MENNIGEEAGVAKGAFERFKEKIKKLSERQNEVFAGIMKRIEERKLAEVRQKLNESHDDGEKK